MTDKVSQELSAHWYKRLSDAVSRCTVLIGDESLPSNYCVEKAGWNRPLTVPCHLLSLLILTA